MALKTTSLTAATSAGIRCTPTSCGSSGTEFPVRKHNLEGPRVSEAHPGRLPRRPGESLGWQGLDPASNILGGHPPLQAVLVREGGTATKAARPSVDLDNRRAFGAEYRLNRRIEFSSPRFEIRSEVWARRYRHTRAAHRVPGWQEPSSWSWHDP